MNIVYAAIPYGVYIQGVSGKLYTEDEWASQETVNGLALYTENCKLLIPMEQFGSSAYAEVGICTVDQTEIRPYSTIYSKSEALQDYDGSTHTTSLIAAYGTSSSLAANKCKNYTLPNGKTNCYLPSMGELNEIFNNYNALNTLLILCMGSGYYVRCQRVWTSTRASNYYNTYESTRFWNIYYTPGDKSFVYYEYVPVNPYPIIVVAPLEI